MKLLTWALAIVWAVSCVLYLIGVYEPHKLLIAVMMGYMSLYSLIQAIGGKTK
jgi:hypothetical protein